MAKIIEFYIPDKFQKRVKWIPEEQRGKLTEFRPVKMADPTVTSEVARIFEDLFNARTK